MFCKLDGSANPNPLLCDAVSSGVLVFKNYERCNLQLFSFNSGNEGLATLIQAYVDLYVANTFYV